MTLVWCKCHCAVRYKASGTYREPHVSVPDAPVQSVTAVLVDWLGKK